MQLTIGRALPKRVLGPSPGHPLRRKCNRIGGRARQAFWSRTISASPTFSNASRQPFLSFHQRAFWSSRTSRQRSKRLRPRAPNSTGDSQMETMLKKPEIFRDSMGRFDRHGKTLSKTAKKTGLIKKTDEINR